MSKRGQAAGGTAVLLAVMAALIVAFVILIPPQERAKLLDDDTSVETDDDIETAPSAKNLLKVNPGRVDYLAQREIEHPLPVVNIYTKTEAKILAEKNVVYAKKGVFSEDTDELKFSIPDLEHTDDVLLSMNVEEIEGKLVVTLNGDEVFNSEASGGEVQPIKLPMNSLRDNNVLIFQSSSPGLAFWATNDVSLSKVKVVADVTSLEAQKSKNIFLVSETEKENLEKSILKFQPSCNFNDVSKLTVTINGRVIYSGVPDCDLEMIPIEFSPDNVNQGENEIVFSTSKGTYLLSHVVVESELKELVFPTYYFDLSFEEFDDVSDEEMVVRVTLDFVDVVARKFGNLEFNGYTEYFDTKEVKYSIDLSDDVVQGTNALKLKPKKTLEIRELRVDLVRS
jgi:hypothetical protein